MDYDYHQIPTTLAGKMHSSSGIFLLLSVAVWMPHVADLRKLPQVPDKTSIPGKPEPQLTVCGLLAGLIFWASGGAYSTYNNANLTGSLWPEMSAYEQATHSMTRGSPLPVFPALEVANLAITNSLRSSFWRRLTIKKILILPGKASISRASPTRKGTRQEPAFKMGERN